MKNIVWQNSKVSRSDRERINEHKGICIWFTGLSGSGKSTLANELEVELHKLGIHTYLLDGDNIRHGLNKNLDFSDKGRKENIRRIGEVAKLFVDAGIVVITAFISPFQVDRDQVRNLLDSSSFIEVFVDADLATCEERDPKGLYKKARNGEIKDFTGVSSTYEQPEKPEIKVVNGIDSKVTEISRNVGLILDYLKEKSIVMKKNKNV